MISILLYSYISLVYTTITYNTGKYTEYTEIVMSRHKQPLFSKSYYYKEAALDEFVYVTISLVKQYLETVIVDTDLSLLQTLSRLKVQLEIPDSLEETIIAITDRFENYQKNQTFNQLASSKLHNNIIHLLVYIGYNFFFDLELRIRLLDETQLLVIDLLNKYEFVLNYKKNFLYGLLVERINLYLQKHFVKDHVNNDCDMLVGMLFDDKKWLMYAYLVDLFDLIINISISTEYQNIPISDSSIAPKNVEIREGSGKTYEAITYYLRNKTKPTCVDEHYYCNISNLDKLAQALSKVKSDIEKSLGLNLPVLIYFETYYIQTILQVFRDMLTKCNFKKYTGIENFVKNFLFLSLYGENNVIFQISMILQEIEAIIYEYAKNMEYTKNNEKKCLYLTVVLNDFKYDMEKVYTEFLSYTKQKHDMHVIYNKLFTSLINEFYTNYKKTIFNVFNSIDHCICKVIQTTSELKSYTLEGITEKHFEQIFCYEQINPIKRINSKISKESILCNQVDWYNEIRAEITKIQLADALLTNPLQSQSQKEHKKNTKRSELQISKKEDTYTTSTNDKNMQSIDKLLEFIEKPNPKSSTKKDENKKIKNTNGKTKAKDPIMKFKKIEVNISKAKGSTKEENYLDDVIVNKTKKNFDCKVLANTNNLMIKDKDEPNLTFINDIKNAVKNVQSNDEKTTTFLSNNTNIILPNSANEHLNSKKSENDAQDELYLAEASFQNKKIALIDIDNSNIHKYLLKSDKIYKNLQETKSTPVSKESNKLKHISGENIDWKNVQNETIDDGFTRVCTKKKKKENNLITNNNQQTITDKFNFADNLDLHEKTTVNVSEFQDAEIIAITDANIKKTTKDLNFTHKEDHLLAEHIRKVLLANSNLDNVQKKPSNTIQCNGKKRIIYKRKHTANIYSRPKESIKVNTEHKKLLKQSKSFNDNKNCIASSIIKNQPNKLALNANSITNYLKQDNKTSLDAQNLLNIAHNDISYIVTKENALNKISYKRVTNRKEHNETQVKKNNTNKSKKINNIISINKKTIDKKHTKELDEEINLNTKIDNTNNEKLQEELFEKIVNRCHSLEMHQSRINSVEQHDNIHESIKLDKIDYLISHCKIYAYIYKGKHFNIKIHLNFLLSNEFVYLHLSNTEIIPLVPVLQEEAVSIYHEKKSTNFNNNNSCVCSKCLESFAIHNRSQNFLNIENKRLQELEFFIGLELSKKKLLCIIYEV